MEKRCRDLNASPNELHQESFGLLGERGGEEVKYQLGRVSNSYLHSTPISFQKPPAGPDSPEGLWGLEYF